MIDPVSTLVLAIVTGAVAGLASTSERAVKDAYNGLKELIKQQYTEVDWEQIEQDPLSEHRQAILKEELAQITAIQNQELLRRAQAVLNAATRTPELAGRSNITVEKIKAANLRLSAMIASGSFSVRDIVTTSDVEIHGVRTGVDNVVDLKK
jgi:hypothetical protein